MEPPDNPLVLTNPYSDAYLIGRRSLILDLKRQLTTEQYRSIEDTKENY